MFYSFVFLCILTVINTFLSCGGGNSVSTYLNNIDAIISRQLENPLEEDTEDLKDNVEEYVKLLDELLQSFRRKDPVALETAAEYWNKGVPSFFHEDNNGDILNKLMSDFKMSRNNAMSLAQLIERAKLLWYSLDSVCKTKQSYFQKF